MVVNMAKLLLLTANTTKVLVDEKSLLSGASRNRLILQMMKKRRSSGRMILVMMKRPKKVRTLTQNPRRKLFGLFKPYVLQLFLFLFSSVGACGCFVQQQEMFKFNWNCFGRRCLTSTEASSFLQAAATATATAMATTTTTVT